MDAPFDEATLKRLQGRFPSSQRTVVLLGLGRLQLGLIGPAFAAQGYKIIAINLGNPDIVHRISAHGLYHISVNAQDQLSEVRVDAAYHFDEADPTGPQSREAVRAAAGAHIVNSALGLSAPALAASARFLLRVEQHRRERGVVDPLFLTSTDNPVGDTFAIEMLRKALLSLTYSQLPPQERVLLWNDMQAHWRFPAALADRICSVRLVPSDPLRPVRVVVEPYEEVCFDRPFVTTRPLVRRDEEKIANTRLWDNLQLARERKIYMLSMAHAMAAYLGALDPSRPPTIDKALESRFVCTTVEVALEHVADAFAKRSGDSITDWYAYAGTVLRRISNPHLTDPLGRVARDVPRKLDRRDRLVGPLLLVLNQSFRLSEPLITALAAALTYARFYGTRIAPFEHDPATESLSVELKTKGAAAVLETVAGLSVNDPAEREVIERVTAQYEQVVHR